MNNYKETSFWKTRFAQHEQKTKLFGMYKEIETSNMYM